MGQYILRILKNINSLYKNFLVCVNKPKAKNKRNIGLPLLYSLEK